MDDWGPRLLLVQNRWVLALAGIGLIILGKRKCDLTAEETLAREPDRAPVIHLRSFEDANRNRKETWVSWIRRFLWPNDEQILRPIFGVLGPFATLAYPSEGLSQPGAVVAASTIPNDLQPEATELMRRSALVILQVDNRLTYGFLSQMRQTLQTLRQTLRPDQVLVYFSQKIDAAKLNVAYQKFVEATRDVFPGVLPPSIDSNRFLAFDDGWQPFLCGSLTIPKFSWENSCLCWGIDWTPPGRAGRSLGLCDLILNVGSWWTHKRSYTVTARLVCQRSSCLIGGFRPV